MGLLSRFQGLGAPMQQDPSWAAYDQGVAGPWAMQAPQQAPTDAAAAAYGGGFNAMPMMNLGLSMMQQSQPQQMPAAQPQRLDPYRFRRG